MKGALKCTDICTCVGCSNGRYSEEESEEEEDIGLDTDKDDVYLSCNSIHSMAVPTIFWYFCARILQKKTAESGKIVSFLIICTNFIRKHQF